PVGKSTGLLNINQTGPFDGVERGRACTIDVLLRSECSLSAVPGAPIAVHARIGRLKLISLTSIETMSGSASEWPSGVRGKMRCLVGTRGRSATQRRAAASVGRLHPRAPARWCGNRGV